LNKYSVNARIIIEDEPSNTIETCLSVVYAQTCESRSFILSNPTIRLKSNFRIFRSDQQQQVLESINHNNTVEIFTENSFHNINHSWKFQMFVILLENISNFETIFQLLSQISSWDMRANFLVGYFGNDDIGEIFKISWQYYVVNINVVAMKDGMPNIFTYFPYSNNSCQEYKNYDVLSDCANLKNTNIFPQKVPLDLNGCEVKVMPYVIPPYVTDYNLTEDHPGRAGIEVTIMRNVAKRMNFRIRMIKNFYSHWGFRFEDGNYSMMYKDLLESKTDMIFGFVNGNASYSKDIDASFSHLQDSPVWFFSSAIEMPQWMNLTNIFDEVLWLAIFSMMLITAIA
ncbi:Ionotropic receptor 7c, partial [Carabus blaptoides fortunei]